MYAVAVCLYSLPECQKKMCLIKHEHAPIAPGSRILYVGSLCDLTAEFRTGSAGLPRIFRRRQVRRRLRRAEGHLALVQQARALL